MTAGHTPDEPVRATSAPAMVRSLRDRLKNAARATDRPVQDLTRQFVLQRFLGRVFADPGSPWILKGGTGLLVRLPLARHSRDLDLMHRGTDPAAALDDLRALAGTSPIDPFRFVLTEGRTLTGHTRGVTVRVEVYLGTVRLESFPIDLSTEHRLLGRVEHRRPRPVLEHPDLADLPAVALYPLPDQVADKTCAMYQRYEPGQQPSTRFRDLVDLVLIVSAFDIDATTTHHAPMHDTALNTVGACLNPLLRTKPSSGTHWNPTAHRWEPPNLR
jgi:predicted nucleotidyltransferase component of viral defense system